MAGRNSRVCATGIHDEDQFRLLVDSVQDYGIFILDEDGRVASWNEGARRLKGYLPAEIIGKHFSLFYPPSEVAAGKCERVLATARTEGQFAEEGWRIRQDGSRFWANVVITGLRNASGELVGYGKVTRDLSERKRAEDEVRKSEEKLRLLVSSVRDYAIFMLDPTGHIVSWNTGARRLNGYSAEEIIGTHFSIFYPEEDVRAGKCEWELGVALEQGRFEEEYWRLRKDGTRFWASVIITPVRDERGELFGFAKVTRDLSERRLHEEERIARVKAEQLQQIAEENEERTRALADKVTAARDKAEQATRLKDEFLATVSHELRTPLNAMLGWSRLLQRGLPPVKAAHALEAIARNAVAQNQIIDDLLDVSRIIAGQLQLKIEDVDIHSVIAAAVDVIRPSAEAKEIQIDAMLEPGAVLIRGDARRLQQVMWNLLSNSVKFTSRGASISIKVERQGSSVRIVVADTGKGITAEFLPHVFERFRQQESSSTRAAGGLGLGLAIVRHLVELHGGNVDAASDGPGTGATFAVTLAVSPTSVEVPETDSPKSQSSEQLLAPAELDGRLALVIDDEADTRALVQSILEGAGVVVQTASSVDEAMMKIATAKPEVIVCDISMPTRDGYEFIRALRQLPREEGGRIPAVALTAHARAQDRSRALAFGFQNHAAKPIEPQELLLVVANLVGRFA